MIYDKDLAPYGTTREYECAKEISERLKNIGEKEISLTKVSILLYLLYKEDKLGENCFKFNSVFYKNVYGIPCNKNVVLNFETERVYKGNIHRYMCWLDEQEKMFDDLMLNYGTMTPAELYTMMQYDVFVANAEINENIIINKELARKAPKSCFVKRLVLGKNKKKNSN